STVAELLKWIYAERFDPAPDTSQALLVLADEYRLPLLAQMCETLIQEGVDETNVCDVLQFAETFRANKLRRYCIDHMAAPTFPSHLIDAAQLKPELLEQIQLRKGSWSEHSRSRRKVKEREARYQQYEEERQTQGTYHRPTAPPLCVLRVDLCSQCSDGPRGTRHSSRWARPCASPSSASTRPSRRPIPPRRRRAGRAGCGG
ncbi:uncharacterized protein ACA1_283540, partial [Acanthamoeba castellanii str. Neff]